MVNKKIATRDYLRSFITRVNKEAGVTYNASKLNNKEECEEYILNLIKNLRHKPQNNKAYIKEIDGLKEEIEILNTSNKRLEAERMFYITQAEEAGKTRKKAEENKEYFKTLYKEYQNDYFNERDVHKVTKERLEDFTVIVLGLGAVAIIEAISIVLLSWK